jgi:hypothetical protein
MDERAIEIGLARGDCEIPPGGQRTVGRLNSGGGGQLRGAGQEFATGEAHRVRSSRM